MAKQYSNEEIEFLKENAPKFGAQICAEKLNRKVDSVRYKLSRLGICSKRDKSLTKEDIDNLEFKSSFKELSLDFSKTNTPKELAYFLGFFWADGYNKPKDKALVIEITEEDGTVLEPIFMRLATFSIYKRSREGRKPQITFYYRDEYLFEFINSLGKYPNSTESHEKVLKFIPDEYLLYFLRGLIDGDGSYYLSDKAVQFNIASSINQDWSYLQYVLKKYGMETTVNKTESEKGNSSHLRCSNPSKIKAFLNVLYRVKDHIWLDRKYLKAQMILNNNMIE